MKILVTGANGLLGQKLTSLLSGIPDVNLVATARTPLTAWPHVAFRAMDITDATQVKDVIKDVMPDAVIHAAAMTQVDTCETDQPACYRANVEGTQHVADACRASGAHLVHLSTDFIFNGLREMLVETDQPDPVNYYGRSKLLAEEYIRQSPIDWAIIRTVLVYGVTPGGGGRSNILTWVKRSLEEGKRIQVVNDQWRTPTLAEDLAYGCYLAAVKRARGVYHISGKDYMSVHDIAVRAATYFGLDTSLITPVDSDHFVQPGRRPPKTGFVIDKARRDLGFEPRTFSEGLAVVAAQLE